MRTFLGETRDTRWRLTMRKKWLLRLIEKVKVSFQTVASGRLTDCGQGIKTRTHNRGCVCTPVGLSAVSHASTDWFQFKSDLRRGKQGHSSTSQTLAFLLEAWLFICSNQSLKEPKGSNWHQWKTNGWPCSEQMPVNRVVRVSNISVANFNYQEVCSFWLFFSCSLDLHSFPLSVNLLPLLDTKEKTSKDAFNLHRLLPTTESETVMV